MELKNKLLKKLAASEKLARTNRLFRFAHHPFKYLFAVGHKKWIYDKTKEGTLKKASTFFGDEMLMKLPAATDIYLTGAKSHDSEIRFARFLIKQVQPGNIFLDVGAHYGYYSMLFAHLTGNSGRVFSIEPSKNTFKILQKNTSHLAAIQCFNMAASNTNQSVKFYEFPILYSEYNTTDNTQFFHESWYENNRPTKVMIEACLLDEFMEKHHFKPDFVKIDVEGAESKVIEGGHQFFEQENPTIIMEYLEPLRYNIAHQEATQLLFSKGYKMYFINDEGSLEICEDIEARLKLLQLESDNVVFKK